MIGKIKRVPLRDVWKHEARGFSAWLGNNIDVELLKLLAQSLVGPSLSGRKEEDVARLITTTSSEQSALGKLLVNYKSLIESRMAVGPLFK